MPTTYTPDERLQIIRRAEERLGLPPGEPADPAHRRRSYPANLMPRRSGGGAGGGRATEERIDLKAIEACWALYRCFTVRADGIAGLPVKLWQGRGEDASELTAGAAWALFDRPNPHWSLARLLGMTEWTLNTSRRGAFWILDAFDGQGRPTEIWWADPRTVRPVRGKPTDDPENQYISHYEVAQPGGAGGKAKRFEREHVVWFQSPHPFSEFESFPSLLAAIESAGLALSSLYANRMLHETGMTGAGYVVPEEGVVWDDDQREEVAGMFATTVKGKSGWHRVMVASRRDFEVRDLQALSPRDVQFAQLMKLTTEQVCIASGVPLPLIQPTDATFSNVDGSISILWSLSLIPRAGLIAGAIKSQLTDVYFEGEVDQVELWTGDIPQLQDDAAAKWQLDQSQLGAMLDLADRVARGYERTAALKAAVFYIGCPEDVAEVIIPAPRVAAEGEVVDAAKVIELPPLTDIRLLLGAVSEGSLSRESAIAVLEAATGDRATAEAIVADTGTGQIQTAPVTEIAEARAIVAGVTRGEIPRMSAVALLARLFGDQGAAAAVVADAEPLLALSAGDAGDGVEGAGAADAVATPAATNGAGRPGTPPTTARTVILYRGGQGYRLLPTGDTEPLMSNGHADAAEGEHRDEDADDVRIYGSEAHRRAWQDEVDKIEERSGPIHDIVDDLFGGQHREVERGLDGLSDDALARIVEETGIDLDDPTDADMDALAGALALAVLGRAFVPRWIERGLTGMLGGLTDLAGVVGSETLDELGLDDALDLAVGSPMTRMLLARAGLFAEQTTNTSWLRVGQVLARGVQGGEGMRDLAKRVEALGKEWRGSRALTVAWTETHSASQAVARETVRSSGVAARRRWLSALDARVRDDHVDAHGQEVGIDEPYEVGGHDCEGPGECGRPEQDINCIPAGTMVEGLFGAGLKTWYSGPLWEIETRRGHRLSVTPNHPVLTDKGWVKAQAINEGANLVSYCDNVHAPTLMHVDDEDAPAPVENVFDSLGANGRRGVAMLVPLDLHGDAVFTNGNVDVVGAFRDLPVGVDPIRQEGADQGQFGEGGVGAALVLEQADGALDLGLRGIGPATARRPGAGALTLNGGSIPLDAGPLQPLSFGAAADWNTTLGEESKQGRSTASDFISELFQASAGRVSLDDVVCVREVHFDGHVYDLQARDGWMIAQGIVISNCRCVEQWIV